MEETLEGIQIAWEIIISDCSLQVFDSHWDEELKNFSNLSNKPFGGIFVTSNVTKSYPTQTEFLNSEIARTQVCFTYSFNYCYFMLIVLLGEGYSITKDEG